jgi:hypothetical protein
MPLALSHFAMLTELTHAATGVYRLPIMQATKTPAQRGPNAIFSREESFQKNLTTIFRTVGNEEAVLRNSSAGLHHFTKALEADSVQTGGSWTN